MKGYVSLPALASLLVLTIGAAPARAQAEVTPFVSLGSVNAERVGAAIRFAWTSTLSVEVEAGYRPAEFGALSTSVNLLYDLPRLGRAMPYVAGGIGLEQFATALALPGGGIATQSNVAVAVNAGGGVRVPLNDRWGYRSDARWSKAFARWGPETWRVYNGVTLKTGAR
jgi:opacity protein-like surface antigen